MTENLLTTALAAYLRNSFAGFRMDGPNGDTSTRPVQVFEGFLPALKSRDNGQDFPCCLVRPVTGTIFPEQTSCAVDILFGVYAKSDLGYQFVLNLVRHAANALLMIPDQTLGKRFVLDSRMTWDLDEEQPYPGWGAVLHTAWSFRTPEVIPSDI